MAKQPRYQGKFFSEKGNLIHTQDMQSKPQRHTLVFPVMETGKKEHRHFALRNWFGRTLIYWEEKSSGKQ